MNGTQGQTKRVLEWMQTRGPITALQAKDELGIMRLAARIYDIERGKGCDAHNVEMKIVKVSNRDGTTCRIAEYSLASKVRFDQQTGQGYLALP